MILLIQGGALCDISIKEGKPFRFDVWVGGEPVPTIEWFKDDIRIINDDTTSLTVYTKASSAYTLKNAVLSIPRVNTSDKKIICLTNFILGCRKYSCWCLQAEIEK